MATVNDLMGLGMPAALARVVAGINSSGNIFIGADSGKSLIFGLNPSTAYWTLSLSSGSWTGDSTNGGDIVFGKIGSGIQIKQGANGRTGTWTSNGTTPVVVGNTSLAAGDAILISNETPGGTVGAAFVSARTNGTSFSATSVAGDTSTYRYVLVRTNA